MSNNPIDDEIAVFNEWYTRNVVVFIEFVTSITQESTSEDIETGEDSSSATSDSVRSRVIHDENYYKKKYEKISGNLSDLISLINETKSIMHIANRMSTIEHVFVIIPQCLTILSISTNDNSDIYSIIASRMVFVSYVHQLYIDHISSNDENGNETINKSSYLRFIYMICNAFDYNNNNIVYTDFDSVRINRDIGNEDKKSMNRYNSHNNNNNNNNSGNNDMILSDEEIMNDIKNDKVISLYTYILNEENFTISDNGTGNNNNSNGIRSGVGTNNITKNNNVPSSKLLSDFKKSWDTLTRGSRSTSERSSSGSGEELSPGPKYASTGDAMINEFNNLMPLPEPAIRHMNSDSGDFKNDDYPFSNNTVDYFNFVNDRERLDTGGKIVVNMGLSKWLDNYIISDEKDIKIENRDNKGYRWMDMSKEELSVSLRVLYGLMYSKGRECRGEVTPFRRRCMDIDVFGFSPNKNRKR